MLLLVAIIERIHALWYKRAHQRSMSSNMSRILCTLATSSPKNAVKLLFSYDIWVEIVYSFVLALVRFLPFRHS